MIDGWFMRKRAQELKAFDYYSGPEIRKYCIKHLRDNDYLYRIFYYDTEPLQKKGLNPITKELVDFSTTSVASAQKELLDSVKRTPNFALRLGKTLWKNNEWALESGRFKQLINGEITIDDLTGKDVRPLIEQKAVDMKIGLDIAWIAIKKIADLLVIITGDSDIVPVLKFARREGMQVCLDPLRNPIRPELSEHVDFIATRMPKKEK